MGILPISRSLIKALLLFYPFIFLLFYPFIFLLFYFFTFLLLCVFLSVYHAAASLMCGKH